MTVPGVVPDRRARETDPAKLKEIAEAARRNVSGFISAGPTVFWNVEKK